VRGDAIKDAEHLAASNLEAPELRKVGRIVVQIECVCSTAPPGWEAATTCSNVSADDLGWPLVVGLPCSSTSTKSFRSAAPCLCRWHIEGERIAIDDDAQLLLVPALRPVAFFPLPGPSTCGTSGTSAGWRTGRWRGGDSFRIGTNEKTIAGLIHEFSGWRRMARRNRQNRCP
jgi:hypothetical protein